MYLFALSDQTLMRKAISAAFAEYLWVIADADETSKNAFHLKKTGLEQAVSTGAWAETTTLPAVGRAAFKQEHTQCYTCSLGAQIACNVS